MTSLYILVLISVQVDIGTLFGTSISTPTKITLLKDLISPIASALAGAGMGTYFAFQIQNRREEAKLRESEVVSLNMATLALESQMNDLATIKSDALILYQENAMRFIEIPPLIEVERVDERVDMSSVSVLIKLKKTEISQNIRLAQKHYINTINILKRRNSVKTEIDHEIHAAGINIYDNYSINDLYNVIGPNKLALIYKLTEDFIKSLDEALECLIESSEEISGVLTDYYGDVRTGKAILKIPGESAFVFEKMRPPVFKDAKELLLAAGHKR